MAQRTVEYNNYHVMLDTAGISFGEYETPIQKVIEGYASGIGSAVANLKALVELFKEEVAERADLDNIPQEPEVRKQGRKIFIVHGHDDAAKLEVARFLEKLQLEPVGLHEQLNQGQTIIEKFEKHAAEARFVVVLLTPDDVGQPAGEQGATRPRARQNVILELGFFAGSLGRQHVVALHKGGVEIPSDLHGVLYEPMDERGGWKLRVAAEIRGAGIEIDLNLAV